MLPFQRHIIDVAVKYSDRPAVVDQDQTLFYRDLTSFSKKLNPAIKAKKQTVGLYFDKGADYIRCVFALMVGGIAFVPLDPKSPSQRLTHMMTKSDIKLIITNKKTDTGALPDGLEVLFVEDILSWPELSLEVDAQPSDLAYVIYTSGTSGLPKGVEITHAGIFDLISQQVDIFGLNLDRIFLYLAISFDASLSDILCSFYSGSTLYINEKLRTKFKDLASYIVANGISYLDVTPSVLKLLDHTRLTTIKTLTVGGEVADFQTIRRFASAMRVVSVYGPTEATICTSYAVCSRGWDRPLIGTPLSHVEYTVMNESMQVVGPGSIGELYISGSCLARGYSGDEEMTSDKFVTIGKRRYYKSGDIVNYCLDGQLEFIGRRDRQIKHNGNLICLEEIEAAANSIAGVKASVASYENGRISLRFDGTVSASNLRKQMIGTIPRSMIPHVVEKAVIPLSATDKVATAVGRKAKNLTTSDLRLLHDNLALDRRQKSSAGPVFKNSTPRVVLLTGATGFLGAWVIRELKERASRIICVCRGISNDQVKSRIVDNLRQNKIYLTDEEEGKLEAHAGDVSLVKFGLSDELWMKLSDQVDTIYHCAGTVNNLKPFSSLYPDNVQSVIEVAKLLETGVTKTLHFASSLSVYVSSPYSEAKIFDESPLVDDDRELTSGYAQSKWLADYYLSTLNGTSGNIYIYRFGLLTDDQVDLIGPRKSFLKTFVQRLSDCEEVPDSAGLPLAVDLTPIDYAAHAMVEISFRKPPGIYNISANIKLTYESILLWSGKNKLMEKSAWFEKYRNRLVSRLLSIANDSNEFMNMNLFECTWVDSFCTANSADITSRYTIRKDLGRAYLLNYTRSKIR
jgi:amino acid adenylation domain-containing protein/thioester reductase-like protein